LLARKSDADPNLSKADSSLRDD
jgi:hypothetical protein